jgi:hypothetical protein
MSGRASGDQIGSALLRENLMPGGPGNLLMLVPGPRVATMLRLRRDLGHGS